MNDIPQKYIDSARAGEPVYITDVRKGFAALPDDDQHRLGLALLGLDGVTRTFPLSLPPFISRDADTRRFVTEYVLAEIHNMLSSLGGRALTIHCPGRKDEGRFLYDTIVQEFGIGKTTRERCGYGKCLNVIDRMLPALPQVHAGGNNRFQLEITEAPLLESCTVDGTARTTAVDVFRRAVGSAVGKALLGVDIGGTDIKLVLARDGRLVCCKEFDWYPAGMTSSREFLHPVMVLHGLMAWAGRADRDDDDALRGILAEALGKSATVPEMEKAIALAEKRYGECGFLFDAIGMSFPDIVVGNKIVGGETLKTRGMRDALQDEYDKDFENLTHLDDRLRVFVRPGGAVGIINDGPMAAFTAGVEAAVACPDTVRDGVFAHTLGTELGTGWVTDAGTFPDIPLEVYNFIIDLGSWPEREFHSDDVRSLNNFNTSLPGTLQKYTSQTGVFRLAFKYLPAERPDIIARIMEKGFVVERDNGLFVPTAPKDMRKPFLEFMMALAEEDGDPRLGRIFEDIGVALAVTGREVDRLLGPAAHRRTLFGRLVKRASCFDMMRRGATRYDPESDLAVADESIAETPLMRELGESPDYTIAQFAQAVGAVYFANAILG